MNESTEEKPKKTPKQLEKEAKKSAKLEKFKQKQEQKSSKTDTAPGEVSIVLIFRNHFIGMYALTTLNLHRKKIKRKNAPKKLLNTEVVQFLARRRMCQSRCRRHIVRRLLKQLGIHGGRRKDSSNLNTGYTFSV